jgi:hypothetical protein
MAQTADAVAPLPVPAAKPKRAKKRVNKKARAGARADEGRTKRRMPARPARTAIPAESGHDQQPLKENEN